MGKTMKISKDRETKLIALVKNRLNQTDWFDFGNWDDLIERKELTYEELQWLEKNVDVGVIVIKKKDDERKA